MQCRECRTFFNDDFMRCPNCDTWHNAIKVGRGQTQLLSEVDEVEHERIKSGPWDLAFGGGLVYTSSTLLGGMPGAGKSTFSLQLANALAETLKGEILYIGTEEAANEIKLRAKRLNVRNMARIRVPREFRLDPMVLEELLSAKPTPKAVILDSVIGLVGADHMAAVNVLKLLKTKAVENRAPSICIDHINKEGGFAGLMALQHEVDTLMGILLKDDPEETRILKPIKNRMGNTNVRVEFKMEDVGLVHSSSWIGHERVDADGKPIPQDVKAAKSKSSPGPGYEKWIGGKWVDVDEDGESEEDENESD